MYQEKLASLAQKAASAQGLVELHRSDHGTAGMGGSVDEEGHVLDLRVLVEAHLVLAIALLLWVQGGAEDLRVILEVSRRPARVA